MKKLSDYYNFMKVFCVLGTFLVRWKRFKLMKFFGGEGRVLIAEERFFRLRRLWSSCLLGVSLGKRGFRVEIRYEVLFRKAFVFFFS